jgi:hypothetical protein
LILLAKIWSIGQPGYTGINLFAIPATRYVSRFPLGASEFWRKKLTENLAGFWWRKSSSQAIPHTASALKNLGKAHEQKGFTGNSHAEIPEKLKYWSWKPERN